MRANECYQNFGASAVHRTNVWIPRIDASSLDPSKLKNTKRLIVSTTAPNGSTRTFLSSITTNCNARNVLLTTYIKLYVSLFCIFITMDIPNRNLQTGGIINSHRVQISQKYFVDVFIFSV